MGRSQVRATGGLRWDPLWDIGHAEGIKVFDVHKHERKAQRSLITRAFRLMSAEHFRGPSMEVPFPRSAKSFVAHGAHMGVLFTAQL